MQNRDERNDRDVQVGSSPGWVAPIKGQPYEQSLVICVDHERYLHATPGPPQSYLHGWFYQAISLLK